jgi:hypothetical protein
MADRFTNGLLNAALLILGLAVMVMLYALITRGMGARTDPARAANPADLVGDIIQVEVRNGCGVDQLAARTTQFLRDHGFDVVEVGDHSSFDVTHSQVIDRVGDLESAKKVAAVLNIPEERVTQDIRRDYYLDASIIIGHDYNRLEPFD